MTFVDISTVRGDFCMKFTELLSNQTYTLSPSLIEICWKVTKLCYFNQETPPFLSNLSVIFTGSLLVALKRASLLVMR